jgi:lincosamide nucleotidyltransferase A/C/D/E
MANTPEMTLSDVVEFILLFNQHQVPFTIDGGWCVDALVGKQTRGHLDLDIAILHRDAVRLRSLLEIRGYSEVPRDDSWECNFVMGDDQGHLFDIHTYAFDDTGNNIYGVA